MRVTLGVKLLIAAGIASMSLLWIAPVPTDPPRTESTIVLVIEQPAPADGLCPFV
ncbi:hypothetical protein [Actinoplanes sp. NPDC049599]|uniref:hypothetical protein n=1 Tax=Actinoplanes sp. NPDC049599 TaxID=3363903 RepID=UPI0037B07B3A